MNFNKNILICGAVALSSVCFSFAEEILVKPGTFKGRVVLVNRQSRISTSDLESVARMFATETECNICVSDTEADAAVVLRIIDNPKAPTSLLAPEDHWGEVNVAKLTDDLKSENAKKKFLAPRARKMMIKSLSILCGGGASSFPDNLMNTATLRELDYINEKLPVDMIDFYVKYLKKLGVTPKETVSYVDACEEGWAPAPTNAAQKAIWDEVHALPKDPITIKPEEKKVTR